MTPRELNALADRMTNRPLPADCDGGEWHVGYAAVGCEEVCEGCGLPVVGEHVFTGGGAAGLLVLHTVCAIADCERAEKSTQHN